VINAAAIPLELTSQPRWIPWRYGPVDPKTGKPNKEPWRLDLTRRAASTKPRDWSSFHDAVALVEAGKADGIGYALPDRILTLVDLDDCVDDTGLLHEAADQIVADLGSFAEWSQSGQGVHVLVEARLNGNHCQTKQTPWRGEIALWDHARFVYLTGNLIEDTPPTIEPRQAELDAVYEASFAHLRRQRADRPAKPAPAPLGLDDRELLDRAYASAHGDELRMLYAGAWQGRYQSQSEADLALCNHLAFWAGRDPERIDRLFRASGLMRPKWERDDYRASRIDLAIAGTPDVYDPARTKVRPTGDALGTHPASRPEDGEVGAGASPGPAVKGTRDGTHLPTTSDTPAVAPQLYVVEARAFADVEEASAEPLLGEKGAVVLAAGGTVAVYGDGGAGKTTTWLDQACHLCAGVDWLGVPVPRACVVLWIENEGPRGMFREKLRAKLDAWEGPPLGGRLHVLERPWSMFTFATVQHRDELVEVVRALDVDVVIAGPVARLGIRGGGTPEEVQAFVDLLQLVRAELERPLAFELIQHENKAGEVSGAWEGATDTLAHVQNRGNGHTAIVWRKVRWHSALQGKTWKLNWRDGERFEVDDTPETTDESIADQLLALVREAPGQSWNAYYGLLSGKANRKRRVRDELIADGQLVNAGTAKAMRLFLPGQDGEPEQVSLDDEGEP
jgi:hypothetical protein